VCGKREYERDLGFDGANAKLNGRNQAHKRVALIDYAREMLASHISTYMIYKFIEKMWTILRCDIFNKLFLLMLIYE